MISVPVLHRNIRATAPMKFLLLVVALTCCAFTPITSQDKEVCRFTYWFKELRLNQSMFAKLACMECYRFSYEAIFKTVTDSTFNYILSTGDVDEQPALCLKKDNETKCEVATPESQLAVNSFKREDALQKWKDCCAAGVACCDKIKRSTPPTGRKCPATWDSWTCFMDTDPGARAEVTCPHYIYTGNSPGCPEKVYRECLPNGTWKLNNNSQEHTDYSTCIADKSGTDTAYIYQISIHSISLACLLPGIIIFTVYKQLNFYRTKIHRNMFAALFGFSFTLILQVALVSRSSLKSTSVSENVLFLNPWWCRMIDVFQKYFWSAMYAWMLCEGIYLHKLITAAFKEASSLKLFYAIGWGAPVPVIIIHIIFRLVYNDQFCWRNRLFPQDYIHTVFQVTCLVGNIGLLVNIVRVLYTQLTKAQSNVPNYFKRILRSVSALVVLFGIHFLFLIATAGVSCNNPLLYNIIDKTVEGSQGLIVSLIFCYLNGEVQHYVFQSFKGFKRKSRQPSRISRNAGTTVSGVSENSSSEDKGTNGATSLKMQQLNQKY